jgi:hypothetical protein
LYVISDDVLRKFILFVTEWLQQNFIAPGTTFRFAMAMPADSPGATHVDIVANGAGGHDFCCFAMLLHFVSQ